MKHLIYIFFFLISLNGISQSYAPKDYYLVDSLDLDALGQSDKELIEVSLKKYHTAKDDTSKINTLTELIEPMQDDAWIKYQYYQHGLIEKALKKKSSQKVLQSLKKSLAVSLNNIGYVYGNQGDIAKAIDYYHKSLKIDEELGDKEGIAESLNNIGYIYGNQGDIAKQTEYYQKSLKLREEIGDKRGIAESLNNIGSIYYNQGDLEQLDDVCVIGVRV